MKVDLVMWTYNGAKTLPLVLTRINKVIPETRVNRKFIVDDKSTDDTVKIAEDSGWTVVSNDGTGISDGANTALRLVESDYFCSFEQDLLLSCEWWNKVADQVLNGNFVVASGIRHQYPSACMRKLHEYTAERYVKWRSGLPVYLNSQARLKAAMSWGKTLDNTIYSTKVIREMGGFPKLETIGGVDTVLTYLLVNAGYDWHVDFNVVSLHLNKTFINELRCQYNYGTCHDEIGKHTTGLAVSLKSHVLRLMYSPFAALHPALTKKCPNIIVAYPLVRFMLLKGLMDSRRGKQWKK
ncbi:MAG: glycosyltransferase [Candidatus Aminicenantes bacterium]|jgi:glycosyltransferase involved in cell wall biosynthesis